MYFLLIAIILTLFIANYYIFNKELLSPPVMLSAMFFICSVFGLLEYYRQAYNEFNAFTVFIIFSGLISFTISSAFVHSFFRQNLLHVGRINSSELQSKYTRINVNSFIAMLISLMCFILVYLYFRYIRSIVGISGFGAVVQRYRLLLATGREVTPIAISFYSRIVEIFGNICLFALLYNMVFERILFRDVPLLIGIISWILMELVMSARGGIIIIICSAVYLTYFFTCIKKGDVRKVNGKFIARGLIGFSLFILFFLYSVVLLGRYQTVTELNIVDYLSTYISDGIRNMDLFLNRSDVVVKRAGQETFNSLYKSFAKYTHGNAAEYVRHLEYSAINGLNTGNVYTAFRRYYHDFGYLGLVLLSGIEGAIFTYGYYHNKVSTISGTMTFSVFIYSYFVHSIFFMPIDDMFYSQMTIGLIPRLFIIYIVYIILVKKPASFRIK